MTPPSLSHCGNILSHNCQDHCDLLTLRNHSPPLASIHHPSCPCSFLDPSNIPSHFPQLSKGLESSVYKVALPNGQIIAWKVTDKSRLNMIEGLELQRREAHLMAVLSHPPPPFPHSHPIIPSPLCSTETPTHLSLITTYIHGGDLHSLIGSKTISEHDAKHICLYTLHALELIHSLGVIHGDIKPHNMLLSISSSNTLRLFLTDLGMSHLLSDGSCSPSVDLRGTTGYIAPEVLRGECFDTRIDLFALGVVVFQLLFGYEPFYPSSVCASTSVDGRTLFSLDEKLKERVSPECLDFVSSLLSTNPLNRPLVSECWAHPWLVPSNREISPMRRDFAEWVSPGNWEPLD